MTTPRLSPQAHDGIKIADVRLVAVEVTREALELERDAGVLAQHDVLVDVDDGDHLARRLGIDPQARHLAYPQAVEQHPAARPQSRHGAVDLRARHYTLLSSAPRLLVDLETHNGVIMSPVS